MGAKKGSKNALGNKGGGRKTTKVETALLKGLLELNPLALKAMKKILDRDEVDDLTLKTIKIVIDKQLADKHEGELSGNINIEGIKQEVILAKVKYLLLNEENRKEIET